MHNPVLAGNIKLPEHEFPKLNGPGNPNGNWPVHANQNGYVPAPKYHKPAPMYRPTSANANLMNP